MLQRGGRMSASDAAARARIVSAVMFLSMAATIYASWTVDELMHDIRNQIYVLLAE